MSLHCFDYTGTECLQQHLHAHQAISHRHSLKQCKNMREQLLKVKVLEVKMDFDNSCRFDTRP